MTRIVRTAAAFGLVAAMATVASAQGQGRGQGGGRGMGGGMMAPSAASLVGIPVVAEEIKITEDQKGDVEAIVTEVREARMGLRDVPQEERASKIEELNKAAHAKLAKVLKPEQVKRLEQIEVQAKGLAAYTDEKVKKALEITEEQGKKLQALATETMEKGRAAFQDAQGDFQAAGEKLRAIQKEAKAKAHALLTDAQKTKWSELVGKEIEIPAMGGGGRGGPGGPGAGGPGGGGNRRPGGNN
jgi:hypothetical protein